jgi:hypothetical protein
MLSPDHIAALIDLRVCELRELAARTAVEYWRTRPTLLYKTSGRARRRAA